MNHFKEWVSVTSWHGIADLCRANIPILSRFLWLCTIIASMIMILVQTYIHINGYLDASALDPWVQTPVYERASILQLPTISICSTNKVSKKSLHKLGMDLEAAAFLIEIQNLGLSKALTYSGPIGKIIAEKQRLAFQNYVAKHADTSNWTVYDWSMQMGPDCPSLLFMASSRVSKAFSATTTKHTRCFIKGELLCQNAVKFVSQGSVCYEFQFKEFPDIFIAGDLMSIMLSLNNSVLDYAPILQSESILNSAVTLYFSAEPNVYLGPGFAASVEIPPAQNVKVTLAIEKGVAPHQTFDIFPDPPLPCSLNGSLQILQEKCGCNQYVMPSQDSTKHRFCLPEEAYDCILKKRDKSPLKDFLNHSDCPKSCKKAPCIHKTVQHRVTGMSPLANLTNTLIAYNLLNNLSLTQQMTVNMSQVEIYFESMDVKVVGYQRRASVADLISNIGGQMGIWAGVSIITIIQALCYAFNGFWNSINANITIPRPRPSVSPPKSPIEAFRSRRLGDVAHYYHANATAKTKNRH